MSNITYEYIYMLSETEDIKRVMSFKNSKIEDKYLPVIDDKYFEDKDLINSLFLIGFRKPYLGFYGFTKITDVIRNSGDEYTMTLYKNLVSGYKVCEIPELYFVKYKKIFKFKKIFNTDMYLKNINTFAEKYNFKQIKIPKELKTCKFYKTDCETIIQKIYAIYNLSITIKYFDYTYKELLDLNLTNDLDTEESNRSNKSNKSNKSIKSIKSNSSNKSNEKESDSNSGSVKSKNSNNSISSVKSLKTKSLSGSNEYDLIIKSANSDIIKKICNSDSDISDCESNYGSNTNLSENTNKTNRTNKSIKSTILNKLDLANKSENSSDGFVKNKFGLNKFNKIKKIKDDSSEEPETIKIKNQQKSDSESNSSDNPRFKSMAFNKFKKFNSFSKSSFKNSQDSSSESESDIKLTVKKNISNANPLNMVPKGIDIIEDESDDDFNNNHNKNNTEEQKPDKLDRIMKIVQSDNLSEGGGVMKNKPLSSFQKLCNINKYNNIQFLDEIKKEESEKSEDSDDSDESDSDKSDKKPDSDIEVDEITWELQDENSKNLINCDIPVLWVPCEELHKNIIGNKISKIFLQNHYEKCEKCETNNNNNKNNVKVDNMQVTHRNNTNLEEMESIIKHYKHLKPYSMTKKFYKDNYSKETNILLFYSNPEEKYYNNCMFILNVIK
jgi:hypothetical protein